MMQSMTENPLPFDHVIDGIYIAGWRAVKAAPALRAAGIRHVLKLYEDIPYLPADFNTFENALDDGEFITQPLLQRGVGFIKEQVQAGNAVLVMCGAGMSRSATFVLAYLLETGHDLHAAYRLLRRAHPETEPHPRMWQSLITHYGLNSTLDDILNWLQEDD